MMTPNTPMTETGSTVPYVPTGYESLQAEIARRRAIGDALVSHSLGQQAPMVSPFQMLAQIVQAWGGNKLEGQANQQQADLDQRRMGDYQNAVTGFQHDISDPTKDQTQVLAAASSNPYLAHNGLVEAMLKAQQKKSENASTVNGAPIQLATPGPDGKPVLKSYIQMQDGTMKPIDQGVVPEKLGTGPSGQLFGEYTGALKGVMPDVSKNVIVGADGHTPITNTPAVTAAKEIAAAGKTSVNTTLVNTGESAYGKGMGEGIAKEDTAILQAGRDAPKAYQSAQRIKDLLKQHPITGSTANARLALDSLLSTIGITGSGTVTATQNLQAELANTTLANIHTSGLGAGQGFTDKDREFLEAAKAGTLEKSADNILHLADLNQRAAIAAHEAGRRVLGRMKMSPTTALMVPGLENDYNVPIDGSSPGSNLRPGFTARVGTPR
jgi:hypothetical protein